MSIFLRDRFVRFALLLLISVVAVTTSLIRSDALLQKDGATAPASDSITEFQTKLITEWVGERFVFLGRDPSIRKYGYQLIYPAAKRTATFPSLPYNTYVGKVVKITSVTPPSTRGSGFYNIEMVVEKTGERLRALATDGTVRGLGPMADIERARVLYVGRTLWRKAGSLTIFDEQSGKTSFISIEPFDALKVIAVTAGWDDSAQVRIIVRTPAGVEGYVDVNFSGTNVSDILRNHHRFDKEFQLIAPERESPAEAAKSYKPTVEALAYAAEGKDVLGWQQSWWGMRTDELVQTFGSQLRKLPERNIYDGMYAEYVIPNYKIGDDPYTVIFQMDNRTKRLAAVKVRSEEYSKNSPYLGAFEHLEALLLQKYGSVRSQKNEDGGRFVMRERQWVFPTTTILLSYYFSSTVSNMVVVSYYPTAASDAKKL